MKKLLLVIVALAALAGCGEDNIITHRVVSPPDTLVVVDTVTVAPCADCHHHRHCRRHR